MRRVVLASALALVLAALPAPGASATGYERPCSPPRARTLKDNGTVRVYSAPAQYYSGRRVWACLHDGGGRTSLGYRSFDISSQDWVGPIRLQGSIVGWIHQTATREASSYRVRSKDLASGRVLNAGAGGAGSHGCGRCWWGFESWHLVMDRAGSIAWTASGAGEGVSAKRVLKADNGRAVVIDAGPRIDLDSLRRDGRVITWVRGDETRRARFRR